MKEVIKEQKGNVKSQLSDLSRTLSDTLETIGTTEHFTVLDEVAKIGEGFEHAVENEEIDTDDFAAT